MIKMIYCIRRKDGMTPEQFQAYWRDTHGPLVRKNASALGVRRYVQSRPMNVPLNGLIQELKGHTAAYDGVAELWWDSQEALEAAAGTPEGQAAQALLFEDEGRFINMAMSCSYLSEEETVYEDRG